MDLLPVDVNSMDKDALAEYAKRMYDVDLNKRGKLDDLRKDVLYLAETGELPNKAPKSAAPKKELPKFLKHPVSGVVFDATPILLKRGDMIPCDAEGTSV